ncbi:nucleic acid-binding protein [Hesseltinella vesiculosa]|uniref:Nucleic acid-binding protein n=1 Tax=Hesseltinella vesiculosa TaxID=101127 RepID=A0A1X2GSZ1_9FUNG|nr:nucleic acid-binding protein [Hesseltinella vesiculosa]
MGKKQTAELLLNIDDFQLQNGQQYAQVMGPRGNHQHEVEFTDGSRKLVTLPPKFRNLVWVKRGHFVVVDPSMGTVSEKVGGEIVHVLFPKHIKMLQQQGQWPGQFSTSKTNDSQPPLRQEEDDDSQDDGDDDLFVNNNRPVLSESESSESDSD